MSRMIRQRRPLVVRIETQPNDGPSRDLFPLVARAILACGHSINLGVGVPSPTFLDRPRRMACRACPREGAKATQP
jgi:hypothetical protein